MFFRRVSIPVVLTLTLLLQFLPGTVFSPSPVAAVSCDVAQFIADVTIPDGTSLAPGATYLKTWRLKNIGSCTWSTAYSAVFTGGDQMGAPAVVNLPSSVAPGATVDISVNITAPSAPGHYRGNWKLRNASGSLFGVGAAGAYVFWVDINVNTSYTYGAAYDFVANYASAAWSSGSSVLKVDAPQLENGSTGNPGLLVTPQNVAGGYIQGVYPAFAVQAGDRFQSIVNCAYNAPNCYVNFRLNYQIGAGPVKTLWSFNERYEGLYYRVNLDLSSLAGQSVNFILYVADVPGHGTPSGDQAMWVETKIARSGSGPIIIPPVSTCDKGAFVADVTIPDGSLVTAGTAFAKTWRIRNVGSCTWTTDYALVYVFGDPLGSSTVVNLPASVAPVIPGATADFTVNMVAPSTPGHYRSYWRFRNASGVQFGVGSGMITFFADINVAGLGSNPSTTTITADTPDPSIPGQSVAVSVSVVGSSVTPTGTVVISGADSNCTFPLSGGSGNCDVVFNTSGAKTLTATYSGDSNYTSSVGTASHTVNPAVGAASTTTITADTPDPSTPSQSVAVSVTVSGSGATPTGTVSITGADTNCSITLSSGSGTCNVVFNTAGIKTLTAAYSGDGNYVASSDTESHTVNPLPGAPSTTSIIAHTPNPSTPGQAVTVNVSVSGAGAAPTGTVDITGADNNCTLTLSGGSGSCNVVFSTTGHKILTALYNGDTTYASSSDTEGHDVVTTTALTITNITADTPDPSIPGQVVDVEVTVTGSGTYPTGTVDITGADTNCTITLGADGHGTCNVVFATAGPKTLTAVYNGNINYSSSSDTESHTVSTGLAATATTITSNVPDPSTPGQAVVVSVTVSGAGLPAPTGTVDITGADTNCSILLAGGIGSCSVIFNTTGHKTLTATYSGDWKYAPSSSSSGHTVIKGSTTTTIIIDSPDPSTPTKSVEVEFSVIGAGVTPTGIVSVTGADVNCSITLSGGSGSCNVVFNTIGAKVLTATYSGDANYLGSSDTEDHSVLNVTTTIITSDNADPSTPGEMITVNYTVSGAGPVPTGTVEISGADSTCGAVALVGGSGTCNVVFNTAGAKVLTATYSGDANYVGSVGTANHTVNKGVSTTTLNPVDNPDPSVTYQTVTVSAMVTGAGVTPTGTVGITISGTPAQASTCTVVLVAGAGSCTVVFIVDPASIPSVFTINAAYSGDGNYYESSDTEDHTVN
jgi:hypothetical protein